MRPPEPRPPARALRVLPAVLLLGLALASGQAAADCDATGDPTMCPNAQDERYAVPIFSLGQDVQVVFSFYDDNNVPVGVGMGHEPFSGRVVATATNGGHAGDARTVHVGIARYGAGTSVGTGFRAWCGQPAPMWTCNSVTTNGREALVHSGPLDPGATVTMTFLFTMEPSEVSRLDVPFGAYVGSEGASSILTIVARDTGDGVGVTFLVGTVVVLVVLVLALVGGTLYLQARSLAQLEELRQRMDRPGATRAPTEPAGPPSPGR